MSAHATRVSSGRAAADIAIQIVAQLLNVALGVIVTALIVRTLGPTRYGQWSTLLAITELVGTVGSLGLENVAVRFATAEPERENVWLGAVTTLRAALTIPVIVLYVIAVIVISRDQTMLVTGLVMTLLYLTSIWSTLRIAFRLRVRNDIFAAFVLANSVLWTGAVVVIAAAGGGMVPLAIAFVTVSVLVQGMLGVLAFRTVPVRWRGSRALWPRIARLGLVVGIGGALTLAYGSIDQLLVFEFSPHVSEAGLYAAMYKILDTAGFVPIAVMTTLFPIMAGLYPSEPARLRRLTQIAIDYLTIVSLGGLAFTIAAAGEIVALLFGPAYREGTSALPVLMAAFVPICIGFVGGNMVLATDLQRRYIYYAVLGLLVNVVLNLIFIPVYGFQAAAWVTLATELIVVSLTLVAVLRKIEMRLSLHKIGLAALAASASALVVWRLRDAGAQIEWLLLAMGVLYPALLIALRALNVGELLELVRGRKEPSVSK
ncbi:MAG TPA: flippase [Solirubrobacteraceae bacterium]|jgi:O-antigen/teichoic acid export membrane protein